MIKLGTLLAVIGSTEETSFNELCVGLGDDCPERGAKDEWRDLFGLINQAERQGFIKVDRLHGNRIEGMILTEAGVAAVKGDLR